MILESVRHARLVLLKNNLDSNIIPLISETLHKIRGDFDIHFYCYNHPAGTWRKLLNVENVKYYECNDLSDMVSVRRKATIVIESFNQLCLLVGAQHAFTQIHNLMQNPLVKILIVYHNDCQLSSRTENLLEHIMQMVVIPLSISDMSKLRTLTHCKKGNRLTKTIEDISYDGTNNFNCVPIPNEIVEKMHGDTDAALPCNITTFKITLDNKEKLARNELELPYMKRPQTGQVYYEHDAADDWDDEDPDEDLDI